MGINSFYIIFVKIEIGNKDKLNEINFSNWDLTKDLKNNELANVLFYVTKDSINLIYYEILMVYIYDSVELIHQTV